MTTVSWTGRWKSRVGLTAIALAGLAAGAAAQTPPSLERAVLFGGAGSQRGTAVGISGPSVFVAGWDQAAGLDGLLVRYDLPPAAPLWSATKPGANFNGLAVTSSLVFPVGAAVPGTCAGDVVGGVERRSLFARYTHGGVFLDCNSPNFFPFDGQESYAAASEEDGETFVYTAGRAQQNAFGTGYPFILVKYTDGGAIAAGPVTEPGVFLGSPTANLCNGESSAEGLTVLNGNVYVVGYSRLTGGICSEDNFNRPVIMKYDPSLNRVWKVRANVGPDYPGFIGSFRAVTGLDGHLYAVGAVQALDGTADYLVEKFDESGQRVWSAASGGGADDVLTGVTAVGSRLFAVGYTYSLGSGRTDADVVVLEIDPATGATLSTTLFGGVQDDFANGAASDGTDLYVVGESRSFGTDEGNAVGESDALLLRYRFNRPPVANAGPDQLVAAGPACAAEVTLDGTGSSDPDGDALSFEWTGPFGSASGPTPTVTLPLDAHTVGLVVDDGKGGTDADEVGIEVVDVTPPDITDLVATPSVLWPPDHKFRHVTVVPTATDACSAAAPACRIVSVTSDEPVNGVADGNTAPDWIITGELAVKLRAERSGVGDGRVYTITVACVDELGNGSTETASVVVPKNGGSTTGLCARLLESLPRWLRRHLERRFGSNVCERIREHLRDHERGRCRGRD
jgi:hypothetical protein